jgi:hypothetical protein
MEIRDDSTQSPRGLVAFRILPTRVRKSTVGAEGVVATGVGAVKSSLLGNGGIASVSVGGT